MFAGFPCKGLLIIQRRRKKKEVFLILGGCFEEGGGGGGGGVEKSQNQSVFGKKKVMILFSMKEQINDFYEKVVRMHCLVSKN